jgi:predicted AlkP superfamily phosphohydrolase/phosphomutase
MNRFLEETGFLKLKGQKYFTILNMMRGFARRFNYLQRQSKGLEVVRESDPRNYSGKVEQWVSEELLDWNRTRAFADQYGIRINMRGREPNGIVSTGKEATHVFRELTDELLKLRFPHNGKPVFTHIESCQDVYIGPFVEKAPDLVTFMDVGSPHYSLHVEALFGESRITTGSHRKDGIFIGWGQGIKQGQRLQKAKIVDITPTVLYCLGIPLTPEMDGRVLDLFEKGLDLSRVSDRRGTSFLKGEERPAYTPEQEGEIENRLKGLGYLG